MTAPHKDSWGVRRGLHQVPRVQHLRTSTEPSTCATGSLRCSFLAKLGRSLKRARLTALPITNTSFLRTIASRALVCAGGPRYTHRSTEGVAAGPDEYSATPANNDEEADFFVRFFASLLYYTMYNIQFVEKRRKKNK